MVSRRAVVILLVVYGMAMLAKQTEGFLPIFTHSDMQRMQVTPEKHTAMASTLKS